MAVITIKEKMYSTMNSYQNYTSIPQSLCYKINTYTFFANAFSYRQLIWE